MGDDPGRDRRWWEVVVGRFVVGLALALLLAGALRAVFYFGYAAGMLPFPLESHQLEGKMVLMAYRAQAGLSLYPEWREYPHVANFFAPIDFLLVGGIGRLAGADLRGLFLIGRAVSFVSGLLVAVVLGAWAGRRYGRGAGVVAAILSVGGRPMDGFSVTTRPDMPAELLGVVGFLLTGARAGGWKVAGIVVLVLAAFTKQTAVLYLLAAALALAWEGHRRWSVGVLGGGLGAIALVVAGVTLAVEPNFARGLLGEAATPWDLAAWLGLMKRLAVGSPDVLLLPAIGFVAWTVGRDRSPRLAALAVVPMAVALVSSMKRGADVNYFLGLRAAEAMAAAALWASARGTGPSRRSPVLAVALAAASIVAVATPLGRWSRRTSAWGRSRTVLDGDLPEIGPRGRRTLNVVSADGGRVARPTPRAGILTDLRVTSRPPRA